ncbi:MAG: flippase [Patescibacteria group bacterium]|jgi:O-antigen/teichoic acid export membrane protein
MSTANKIFTNTLWQVVIRIVNIFIGVFSLALITRMLGQAGFGYYTTIFAFVQIFAILADLGLYVAMLREISAVKDSISENKIINNIFTIRVISSLVMLILIPIVVQFFPYSHEVKLGVILFMGTFFFQTLMATLAAVFSKKLDMARVAIVDFVNKLLYAGFLLYLFIYGFSLNAILWGNAITMALAFILLLFFIRKHAKLSLAWDFTYWKVVWHRSWPLAITVVLNLLYFKADTLVLSAYRSPEEVGLYGAPYRVLEVMATFPHMFMSLILPIFTASWVAKKIKQLNDSFQYSFDFFSVLSIAMLFSTWLVSKPLMIKLAGEEFASSGPILNVLILATVGIFFGTLFIYLIVALDAQKQMIKYFLWAAIIALIGYFIFIPTYSYWGAAYITLLVEWLIVIFAWRVARRNIELKINFKVLYKSLIAGVLSFWLAWMLQAHNIIFVILLAWFLYLILLILFKTVSKQNLKNIFLNR